LWVYLIHNGTTSFAARQATILRIDPNKGPLTGTYGGLTFTDMTVYTQFGNTSANTGGIDHRSGSWSESNHTHAKKSRNISGTLITI